MRAPTPEQWAQIRYEYEHTRRPVIEICSAYGTTPNTLRRRGRQWNWRMRHPPIPDEGPEAVAPPGMEEAGPVSDLQLLGPRLRGDERVAESSPPMSLHTVENLGAGEPHSEPSPHLAPPMAPADTRPLGERLQGAVTRVLPALETTLATLAAGPMQPRQMEQAARALGSLTRTLRELNGLLGQHPAQPIGDDPPPEDMDDFRNELARRIETVIASHEAQIPARYQAAWEEFAAEAKRDAVV